MNHINIAKMFLLGKKTLGDSSQLKKLISTAITEDDYARMKTNKPEVIVTVSNLSRNEIEYKTLKECDYNDFCDWMWASANVVPFMSLMVKDGYEYADGGMGTVVPIYKALLQGATDIDVILLKSSAITVNKAPARNALEVILRIFDFMLNKNVSNDLIIGKLEGLNLEVKLNIWQPQQELTTNPLIFDREQMEKWWSDGYTYAHGNSPVHKDLEIEDGILNM
jgi:NTE family protein